MPYFIHMKTQSCFFRFSFCVALFFPLINALVYVNIDQGTMSCHWLISKIPISVKTNDLWSYLKVFTGIKKKIHKKKIFFSSEKIFFRPSDFQVHGGNFFLKNHNFVKIHFGVARHPGHHAQLYCAWFQGHKALLSTCAFLRQLFLCFSYELHWLKQLKSLQDVVAAEAKAQVYLKIKILQCPWVRIRARTEIWV